jgi:DNA-binding GntR family transcriptional regulator
MTGSLSSLVYDKILHRMLSGSMSPGQEFNRRQIAGQLGVSVAPVLEAMLQLRAEGLIETRPRQGTRVRIITLEDLRGQLIVREALECQAARLYCGEPIRKHMKRLTPMARRIDATDVRSAEHVKEEVRFHHSLVALANVPALTAAYERVMKLGLLYAIQVHHPDQAAAVRCDHMTLLMTLTTDIADEAEAAMRAHAQAGKEVFFAFAEPVGIRLTLDSPIWLAGEPRRKRSNTRSRQTR